MTEEDCWKENFEKLKSHHSVDDEEIDNFLQRVNKVELILRNMRSDDDETVKLGMAQANEVLGKNTNQMQIDEEKLYIKKDRSVINRDAFKDDQNQQTMEIEAFKRSVEADANRRAEERRQRKEVAERLKNEGNKAFRNGNYNKALDCYNKALDEVKDSCVLYTNRALTLLKLELYQRALEDTEKALYLNESSLKALLYKSQALANLSKLEESKSLVELAVEKHTKHKQYILEYTGKWLDEKN